MPLVSLSDLNMELNEALPVVLVNCSKFMCNPALILTLMLSIIVKVLQHCCDPYRMQKATQSHSFSLMVVNVKMVAQQFNKND